MKKLAHLNRGFLTLEMLLAMTILILCLTTVVLLSFGNQSILVDSATNVDALDQAEQLMAKEQTLAAQDFNLVVASSSQVTVGAMTYTDLVKVETNATDPTLTDYTKRVIVDVQYPGEFGRTQNVFLTALITNYQNVSSEDSCSSVLVGSWNPPHVLPTFTVSGLSGLSGSFPITSMEAYQNKLYVGVSGTLAASDPKLFVFDISSPNTPVYKGSLNTTGTTLGPNALAIAPAAGGKTYAYIANGASSNWNTCTVGPNCSQLEVVDVTNPAAMSATYFRFATSSAQRSPYVYGSGGQGAGKSVYYQNGYLYLGLTQTLVGPDFIMLDVHDPLHPMPIASYSVPAGATINSIRVRGNFAYLATSDKTGNILTILDISNVDPTSGRLSPMRVWSPMTASSFGVGNDVSLVGNTLYFGASYNNPVPPEFFEFNNTDPSMAAPTLATSTSLGGTLSAKNLVIRDYLAFILNSTNSLQFINASSTAQYTSPLTLSGNGTALACEGNYVYAGTSVGAVTAITGS